MRGSICFRNEKAQAAETRFRLIAKYPAGARKKLESARKTLVIDEEASYQLAYEAMLKASLGFMLSFSVRPRSLPSHHITIIEFSGDHLGKEFKHLILTYCIVGLFIQTIYGAR